jgi:hypothetical protein
MTSTTTAVAGARTPERRWNTQDRRGQDVASDMEGPYVSAPPFLPHWAVATATSRQMPLRPTAKHIVASI